MMNIYWMLIFGLFFAIGICFLDESGKCPRFTRFLDKIIRRLEGR